MKENLTGSVRSSSLEVALGKTIMGEFIPQIDNYFRSTFSQKGNNISIPTLGYLFTTVEGMEQRFIDLYNSRMGLENGVEKIPDALKASQGALLDGLCFGYDLAKEEYALYTMNFNLLSVLDPDESQRPKQCMDSNKKALLKSYRVDIEYQQSPESFSFKLVNHRKKIDDDKEVVLIPYLVILRLMLMIESFMQGNMILKTKQDLHGAEKVRVITKNKKVLADFCDDPIAPTLITPAFFPLRGFFYAPVVGAPSTTAMVTNIDLFKLDELKRIATSQGVKKLGVEKPNNPIYSMVSEQVIVNSLMSLKVRSTENFIRKIQSMPKAISILGDDPEAYTSYNITKYLHSISSENLSEVIKSLPGVDREIKFRESQFSSPRQISEEEGKDLRGLLRNHVVKFILKKKDCKLSSITCTNSPLILRSFYGRDYFSKYEGFNIRFNAFLNALSNGEDTREALSEYGFSTDPDLIEEIKEISKAESVQERSFEEALRYAVAENEGVALKSSSKESDNILVRLLNAYIDEEGKVVDYYRSIDPRAIVNILVLS